MSMIDFDCYSVPYEQTGFFSTLVNDYLSGSSKLTEFYAHQPNIDGIKASIKERQLFDTPRELLITCLEEQYAGLEKSEKLQANLKLLSVPNTFTITTAHQPNIFTGPLYFIYKILHTVKLANQLAIELPEYNFVPVYYMGSEDADLDELGQINLAGQPLVWNTKQTGAVGRMKVDKPFLQLIEAIEGQIGVLEYGLSLIQVFKSTYTLGKTIQQATLELVNHLFANYGVIVLIPDSAKLKSAYHSVIKKEILEKFSHQLVNETIHSLKDNYKVQTAGREINLFYLLEHNRVRIEWENDRFQVKELGLSFSQTEIIQELDAFPERFSANVILRGGFQETVLPNIAFIGGGGELAYWMELKKVFDAVGIPYPVLVLRNSFLLMKEVQFQKILQLGINLKEIFQNDFDLLNQLVKRESKSSWNISEEIKAIKALYLQLQQKASNVDGTLNEHVISLEIKSSKKLAELEKKMLRAERNKFEASKRQITAIKTDLFPNNSLQERIFNFSDIYARMSVEFLELIYEASPALEMQFTIVVVK
jgi:bacillithiol biosynthesis cysteine-adding enzyme BshC